MGLRFFRFLDLLEKRVAAEDQLKRVDMRAPQSGTVHQMTVHTIGGLVTPSEPAMLIVPEADQLAVEVKIQPQDIDNVRLDQAAVLRFSAFNQRTTPELKGRVHMIAADLVTDQRSGVQYYPVRVAFAEGERARLGNLKLVPGMPVEGLIQTGSRTVFSYLTKPVADNMAKAFREE